MTNIGIIGHGYVGKALDYAFRIPGFTVRVYDKFKELNSLENVVDKSDFIFLCVPTPYKDDKIDLTIMDEVMEQVAKRAQNTDKIIIIKSSVIPGTTAVFSKKYPECKIACNPEFLREDHYIEDLLNASRIVIGADDANVAKKVHDLYHYRLPNTKIFTGSSIEAEMCKYMANAFLATKVIFGNEIDALCNKLGADYSKVKEMVVADKRIGDSHLDHEDKKGFGGKCFPKDLVALLALFKDEDVDAALLKTVWSKNLGFRKDKEWEKIPFVKG
ncbi:MAG: UDP-glucose/GDP-mannose dehydrogenase family protein [Candidatus Diapherotrites archaeon]|nr:UDP-glucose/GDP-mannose dehydrogenase family protein [Candidatus Diapherotrites archaeon]